MVEGIYAEKPKQTMKIIMAVTSGEIFTLVIVAAQSQTDAYIAAGRGVIHLFEYVLEPRRHLSNSQLAIPP